MRFEGRGGEGKEGYMKEWGNGGCVTLEGDGVCMFRLDMYH